MPSCVNRRSLAWLLTLLLLLAALVVQLRQHGLATDITQLLPDAGSEALSTQVTQHLSEGGEHQFVLLLASGSTEANRAAAERLVAALAPAGVTLAPAPAQQGEALGRFLFPYRFGLLTPDQQSALRSEAPQQWMAALMRALATPGATPAAGLFEQDPLLLFPGYLMPLMQGYQAWQANDIGLDRHWQDQAWLLTRWQFGGSAFAPATQQAILSALTPVRAELIASGVEVYRAGVVFHAAKATEQAKSEMAVLGSLSLVLVVLMTLLVFRHPAPLGWLLLVVFSSFAVAASACLLLLGQLHAITLVFGTTLIGIAVDYTLHLCCQPGRDGEAAARSLRKPMTLALASSCLAYAVMLLMPFPALRQMAVFSIAGLSWAFITVQCLPQMGFRKRQPGQRWVDLAEGWVQHWQRWGRQPRWWLALALLALAGSLLLRSDDDIRRLQQADPGLLAEQEQLNQLLSLPEQHRFLLIEAKDAQQLLEREEALRPALDELVAKGTLAGYQSVTQTLPSLAAQRANRALVAQRYRSEMLQQRFAALGVAPTVLPGLEAQWQNAPLLTPEAWLAEPALAPMQMMWLGQHEGAWRAVVLLRQVADPGALVALAASQGGVHYLDRVEELSAMMAHYRQGLSLLLALAVVTAALLMWRGLGQRQAIRILAPPLWAIGLTLALLAALGQGINLFHLLGLLLMFGIALDQTLFLASEGEQGHSALAVLLSAASTLAAFGMLSLSATPALADFGLSLSLGLGLALLLAPLASYDHKELVDVS
ncbi:MMPL family transporter [Ferrimonas balearica]|uniref:MMPL family transporter n=1 Tax=Ferrimonas balearica TaxID=44012 RepID=UPI001C98CBDC|nr:MMPL family transporter [Ferrimonas balearica]MBY6224004.1 hypothetical protein [Ferrimonas balearica]